MAQRQAVVAAVRNRRAKKAYEDPLNTYARRHTDRVHASRMVELDEILEGRGQNGFVTLDGIGKKQIKREIRVEELMKKVGVRV
mmetsp:Transcript_15801/g.39775  ORF Transcript_15801/g.39775 Transcript_15801/m.39775 type:complete len:84 (+) Transcript_15801:248-499(+)